MKPETKKPECLGCLNDREMYGSGPVRLATDSDGLCDSCREKLAEERRNLAENNGI